MSFDDDRAEAMERQIAALEESLAGAGSVAAAFDTELQRMQRSMSATRSSVSTLSNSVSRGLKRAFDGLILDGDRLSDALRGVAKSVVGATYRSALKPVTQQLGGIVASGLAGIGAMAFGQGGAFAQGRVMPFARGGTVTAPTAFPMKGGTGLMGEAGPEAILPLARGADGRLGVSAQGGAQPVQVVINVSTPDAESFRRSEAQIAARMSRLLNRGARQR